MRFAFDCRTTPMATAGVPLNLRELRSFSGPSSTRARSRNFTSCPPWFATTRFPNSSGVFSSPSDRTVNSRRSDSIRPAGISTLRLRMAASTSWTVSPRADSSAGSSQIRIEYRRSPNTCARPTPGKVWSRDLTSRSAMSDS